MNKILSKIIDRSNTIISIQLSGRCNFRCKMCGHSKNNSGIMSDEVFSATLDKCLQSSITEIRFSASWGETTLAPNWRKKITRCVNEKMNAWLTTNGSTLSDDDIIFLSESGITALQFSFCGYDKESYEKTYINGNFDNIKKVLSEANRCFKANKKAPDIYINGIIDYSHDLSFVDNTYGFLYSLGYVDENINLVRPNNFGGKVNIEGHSIDTAPENIHVCFPLKATLGVLWDGTVTACSCYDNDKMMSVGNVGDNTFDEILSGEPYQKIIGCFTKKNLSSLEMCSKCNLSYNPERYQLLPSWLEK